MDWRERAAAKAEARAAIHDTFKVPVQFSPDGVSWRVVFCRFHEAVNPDGVQMGSGAANITISSSNPQAVFRAEDVADLATRTSLVSVSPGKAYIVAKAAPADLGGFRTVNLDPAPRDKTYPVPDWDAL